MLFWNKPTKRAVNHSLYHAYHLNHQKHYCKETIVKQNYAWGYRIINDNITHLSLCAHLPIPSSQWVLDYIPWIYQYQICNNRYQNFHYTKACDDTCLFPGLFVTDPRLPPEIKAYWDSLDCEYDEQWCSLITSFTIFIFIAHMV
jgi:hypothetical protein